MKFRPVIGVWVSANCHLIRHSWPSWCARIWSTTQRENISLPYGGWWHNLQAGPMRPNQAFIRINTHWCGNFDGRTILWLRKKFLLLLVHHHRQLIWRPSSGEFLMKRKNMPAHPWHSDQIKIWWERKVLTDNESTRCRTDFVKLSIHLSQIK